VSAEVLLAYRGAAVGYAGRAVVKGAVLDVCAGEVVGLVGPNGAGKSTLLRAVTGGADVLAGELAIAGRPATELTPRERARLVGVVPQTVTAAFGFSARDFVAMGRHAHLPRFGAPGARDREVVIRALEVTDTARLADTPVDELSGGDLQRLALAQALAQEPRVLLLDEPVSHLDLNHRMQILDLVRSLADGGMAVLAVFHELDLATRYADRISIVAHGELGPALRPAEAITATTLREVFGVRAVVGTDPVTGAVSVTPVLRDAAIAEHSRGRVFVVGGSGAAAPLLRRLALDGWELTAGGLNVGDADETVATALGATFAAVAPFAPMDASAEDSTVALAAAADAVVVAEVPFGHGNLANLRAAAHAAAAGVPTVLVGTIGGRDFTGGAAETLWAVALAAGGRPVADLDAARAALDALDQAR